jgi:hypothetical protein
MSKMGVVIGGVLLVLASVSFAQDPVGTPVGPYGMTDPYAGPTPSGMRFGELGSVVSMQTGDVQEGDAPGGTGCPGCRFGVQPPGCDPAWGGPCIDWKLVGWYSSFHDQNEGGRGCHGCRGGGGCGGCRAASCSSCCD